MAFKRAIVGVCFVRVSCIGRTCQYVSEIIGGGIFDRTRGKLGRDLLGQFVHSRDRGFLANRTDSDLTRYQGQHVGLEIVIRFGSKYTYNSSPVLRLLTSIERRFVHMLRKVCMCLRVVLSSEL